MNITTFIIDCDGVLNDGKQAHAYNSSDPYTKPLLEKPFKFFHSRDKTAIRHLTQSLGKRVIIVSADDSDITRAWAESCGAEFIYQRIKVFSEDDGIIWNETVGVGDDLIDLPYLEKCALAFCPEDASPRVKEFATPLNVRGGDGFISHLLWYLTATLKVQTKKETA